MHLEPEAKASMAWVHAVTETSKAVDCADKMVLFIGSQACFCGAIYRLADQPFCWKLPIHRGGACLECKQCVDLLAGKKTMSVSTG